jgi:MoaA/NifB/PqqE/SkfB family radical SAM enzyme
MNFKAYLNTISNTARTLPVVILYVTEGCNLKCVTCSYRKPLPGELSFEEISHLASELKAFGLRHMVYSGGEPLLRRDFPDICRLFETVDIKQTLLTNGLLLEKRAGEICKYFDEIIVSIDGAEAGVHNSIRGVNSFDVIQEGISKAISLGANISIRTVLQKGNFRQLPAFIQMARTAGVKRISFLAADISGEAYGRESAGIVSNENIIALNSDETMELRSIINKMAVNNKSDFNSGFISESPAKLSAIADYYDALNGNSAFPKTLCNAPMVSLVITSTGDVHPCFFLPAFANTRKSKFRDLVNSGSIKATRRRVRSYEPEQCKRCVCTLYTSSKSALSGKF